MKLPLALLTLSVGVLCQDQGSKVKTLVESDNIDTSDFNFQQIRATEYLTHENSKFGAYIEGTSVDKHGNVYAVNYGTNLTQHQFGQLFPKQKLIYADSDPFSLLSSSKFTKTHLYFTEATQHKVLVTKFKKDKVERMQVFCSDKGMIQPNDLTISKQSNIYLSGNLWNVNSSYKDGDIWLCTPSAHHLQTKGSATKLASLARTNGIELSYDQKYLYVSESINKNDAPAVQKIFRYNVNEKDGSLNNKTLFKEFKDTGDQDIDGMKTDVKGNLYVTRYGGSKVVVLNPNGKQILEIQSNILTPSNLEFGGKEGKTLFIVGQCNQYEDYGWGKGCVDKVDLPYSGSQWSRLHLKKC